MAYGDPIPWTALPYLAGWADYGTGASWTPGQYMKDAAGWVYMRGLIISTGGTGAGVNICALPTSCRPTYNEMLGVPYFGTALGLARLDFQCSAAGGNLAWAAGTGGNMAAGVGSYMSLAPVRYFVGW